jgi:hypothetical protein
LVHVLHDALLEFFLIDKRTSQEFNDSMQKFDVVYCIVSQEIGLFVLCIISLLHL